MRQLVVIVAVLLAGVWGTDRSALRAQAPPAGLTAAERGAWLLLNKSFLGSDLDEQMFENTWRVWPDELRQQAAQASPAQRREMAFERYGLTLRPDGKSEHPLQYVVTDTGKWVMNCYACHGGQVRGEVIPGLPNSNFAMQTIAEDARAVKSVLGRTLTPKDIAGLFFPMGNTIGTTNAVMFGVALESFRDQDLNVVPARTVPLFTHHDMDAPPWWHFKKKQFLYADGFVEKSHRALIPFTLIRSNDAARIKSWENDFRDIAAYLETIEPPRYPFPIDQQLAAQGQQIFNRNCASCHGTYGEKPHYDPPRVPIADLGTDPVRLQALRKEHRQNYARSWLAEYGAHQILSEPEGYMAPPLDGIWASAPYFHNGSVPTLWHVLHPEERPVTWKRTPTGYDATKVGLEVETIEQIPDDLHPSQLRHYFQTRQFGKSAAGHTYPDALTPSEKQALLEYLKSL